MKTLVYKRTHHGDPNGLGQFGCFDCMGRVRSWDFEAVIGVGGVGPEARKNGIAGKINWIGVGAHKTFTPGMVDPIVTFDQFRDLTDQDIPLSRLAPSLARRLYGNNVRATTKFTPRESWEVGKVLALVVSAASSVTQSKATETAKNRACRPRPGRKRQGAC